MSRDRRAARDAMHFRRDATALADVRVIYVWFSGGGTFDIDNLHAE